MTSSFGLSENNVKNSAFEEMLLVHKTPTCGCCKMWMKHAEERGMTVYSQDHQNLMTIYPLLPLLRTKYYLSPL